MVSGVMQRLRRSGFGVRTETRRARRHLEGELRDHQERLRVLLEAAADAVIFIDDRSSIADINPAGEQLFGYSKRELIGHSLAALIPDRYREAHLSAIERYVLSGQDTRPWSHVETALLHRSGREIPVEISYAEFNLHGRPVVAGFIRDISERRREEETLRYLAYHDPLTAAPNRSLLRERLRTEIEDAATEDGTFAVLLIDLDGFKHVNDVYGHEGGDAVLQSVAGRLRAALRDSDTLGRMGGDEFVAILPDTDEAGAGTVCQKLLETLRWPVPVEDETVCVGASVGISMYPRDGVDASTLIRHADVAMYAAKTGGLGVTVYRPEMSDRRRA